MNSIESKAATSTDSKIELQLMGQKIVLRAAEDSERTRQIAQLVQERLAHGEARLKTGAMAPHLAAILALFDLAEEYLDAKDRVQEHQDRVKEKADRLSSAFIASPVQEPRA